MKKISAAALGLMLLGATSLASASTIYDGFHVGVIGGYEAFSGKSKVIPLTPPYQSNLGGQGGAVGLQADYFRPFGENSHWGVEAIVLANFVNTSHRIDNNGGLGYDLKHEWTAGGKAIYGYSVGGAMIYGTLGAVYSGFRINGFYAGRLPARSVGAVGGLLGAGVRVPLTEKLMATGEFTSTHYAQIGHVSTIGNGTFVGKTKFDPVVNMFLVGLTYKLCPRN